MQTATTLRFVSAANTHRLRLDVLKPKHERYKYNYAGDGLDTTFHMALFIDEHMVCVASFFEKACPECNPTFGLQLRGMATDKFFQGKGLGTKLVGYALEEAKQRGYEMMWCNARLNAIPFYEKLGFEPKSGEFMVPNVGLHRVMAKSL